MRTTPWPPKPEMRISVRVFVAVAVAISACRARRRGPCRPRSPSLRRRLGRLGRDVGLHALVHRPEQARELRPAVGRVVLDAGLPREVGLAAVGLAPLGVLVDPLQVLERVARAEGIGAEVLVAGEAHVDEREAVVGQRLLDDLHRLVPLRRRRLRHERRAGGLDDVAGIEARLHHAVGAGVGDVARRRGRRELAAGRLVAHVVLADDRHAQVAARGVDQVRGADGGGVAVADDDQVFLVAAAPASGRWPRPARARGWRRSCRRPTWRRSGARRSRCRCRRSRPPASAPSRRSPAGASSRSCRSRSRDRPWSGSGSDAGTSAASLFIAT